jgi:hypothetical protein
VKQKGRTMIVYRWTCEGCGGPMYPVPPYILTDTAYCWCPPCNACAWIVGVPEVFDPPPLSEAAVRARLARQGIPYPEESGATIAPPP